MSIVLKTQNEDGTLYLDRRWFGSASHHTVRNLQSAAHPRSCYVLTVSDQVE